MERIQADAERTFQRTGCFKLPARSSTFNSRQAEKPAKRHAEMSALRTGQLLAPQSLRQRRAATDALDHSAGPTNAKLSIHSDAAPATGKGPVWMWRRRVRSAVANESFRLSYFLSLYFILLIGVATGCKSPSTFYPVGIYSVPTTNDLRVVREAGFNLVAGSAEKGYLDAARGFGLKVLASPHTSAGKGFNASAARGAIKTFDSHPALWAWYLIDEPDLNEIPPEDVIKANRFIKNLHGIKPTALVVYSGYSSLHYANITDIMMIDRYPIPWLPLANFPQHVRMTRLALGKKKPLIAVIQAFDWHYYRELLPQEKDFRPPTYEELRCMTYCALAQRANGLFYYAYDGGGWKMSEHPDVWDALKKVVAEVDDFLPLFQAEHLWWPINHRFQDQSIRFNAALEGSIMPTLLRVKKGNYQVPAGDYVVAVNNTPKKHVYSFQLPSTTNPGVAILGEDRFARIEDDWVKDEFEPYAIHIYGPL